jgi:hypothetical protein
LIIDIFKFGLVKIHRKEFFMKKGFVLLMVMVFGLVLVNGVIAKQKGSEEFEKSKPSGLKARTVKVVATVEAIDLDKRTVTLKGPQGNIFELKVQERVKNLSQVKVGDQVNVRYHEAVAIKVLEPGSAEAKQTTTSVESAKPGEKPAGAVTKKTTMTAVIEAIDAKNQIVTFKGSEGNTIDLKVKDPKYLEKVKVGDRLTVEYTQALAVSVEPAKKK